MERINFYFKEITTFRINKKKLKNAIKNIAQNENSSCGNINIIFCSDDYLLGINKEFLKHNFLTDIITFDYSQKKCISGELYISLERIRENAIDFKVKTNEEIIRVIFHGILHLLGYKDKEVEEMEEMRKKEKYYMSLFENDNEEYVSGL
jgi:probable rRNA maturation factor